MKKRYLLIFILSIALVFSACGKKAAAPADAGKADASKTSTVAAKDALTVAIMGEPSTLDGNGKNDTNSVTVRRQIYENLLIFDNKMNLVPVLAEKYTWEGDKAVVFNIRKGVYFHNGQELKASDVLFSLKRAAKMGFAANELAPIDLDASKVVDDYTFKMVLKYPFAPILANLTVGAAVIVNEKAATELGDKMALQPVGTGPYKLSQWVSGDRIELVKFDKYRTPVKGMNKIVFRIIPESNSRAMEVETGGVDIAYDIATIDKKRFEKNPALKLEVTPNLRVEYIGFNTSKAPYDNVKIRQAIAYALDTKAIVDSVFMGNNIVAKGMLAPGVYGYNDSIKNIPYDPQKAKALLAEAGVSNFKTIIWTNDDKARLDTAEIMQSQLKAAGITAEVKVIEWAAYLKAVENKTLDIYLLGKGALTGDGDALFNQFHSSSNFSGNTAHFKDPAIDKMLEATRTTIDPAKRLEAIKAANQAITDKVPWIPLTYGMQISAMRSNVSGFAHHPTQYHDLSNVVKQ